MAIFKRRRPDDLATLRGTLAHATAIAERERALGLSETPLPVVEASPLLDEPAPPALRLVEPREDDTAWRERALAEAWYASAAGRCGIPVETCRELGGYYERRHIASWQLVYWHDGETVCGAYRCLKCHPTLSDCLMPEDAREAREL